MSPSLRDIKKGSKFFKIRGMTFSLNNNGVKIIRKRNSLPVEENSRICHGASGWKSLDAF